MWECHLRDPFLNCYSSGIDLAHCSSGPVLVVEGLDSAFGQVAAPIGPYCIIRRSNVRIVKIKSIYQLILHPVTITRNALLYRRLVLLDYAAAAPSCPDLFRNVEATILHIHHHRAVIMLDPRPSLSVEGGVPGKIVKT